MAELKGMKFGVKFRLIVFTLGVGLMGMLIALVTLYSQRQAGDLRARLRDVDQESFRIADRFRDSLRALNNTLYRYGANSDPAEWDGFLKGSHELDLWIDEERHDLGMLAAGVAHEIRNPLTAIKAALYLQQKKFDAASEPFEDSKLIEREILRLERIVNDFLMFARPSEPALALTSADAVLQDATGLMLSPLAKSHVRLILEPSPSIPIRVDPSQIKQVLLNLIQNASDAAGPGGEVRLRARRDRMWLGDTVCDVAVLEVSDTGNGIPPEVQKRLFDPFFTTKDSGTGLGLSIAAGIIQKHGGGAPVSNPEGSRHHLWRSVAAGGCGQERVTSL